MIEACRLVLLASCIVTAASVRVDINTIKLEAANHSSTAGTPFSMTTAECVSVALEKKSYEAIIASVLASGAQAQADCSMLVSGPCSLVGGGPPYFYPPRNLGDDAIKGAVMGNDVTFFAKRLDFTDDSYAPPSHDCAKCPAAFNPLQHSCMDMSFADGGWADPADQSMISAGDANWMASYCQILEIGGSQNDKHRWLPEQRKEMSWCSDQVQMVGGYLKNPAGRTGLTGRGSLGLWGPNKAGDPIIVVDGATLNSVILPDSEILQVDYNNQPFNPTEKYVRLIKRTDVDAVAIPGGMIDPGESGLKAAIREFAEEAMEGSTAGSSTGALAELTAFFSGRATLVYQGLVDDPRNTDDAWMETQAYKIEISGSGAAGPLEQRIRDKAITGRAGDDADSVRWLSLADAAVGGSVDWFADGETKELECCYASHFALIRLAYAADKRERGDP